MPADQVMIEREDSSEGVTCCSDSKYYPWGTSFTLEGELLSELKANGLSAGDVVEVRGYAFVDSKSERIDTDGVCKTMRLQMTSLKLTKQSSDRIKQMYGVKDVE